MLSVTHVKLYTELAFCLFPVSAIRESLVNISIRPRPMIKTFEVDNNSSNIHQQEQN